MAINILHDYKLKLIALVFAIFIWFFVVTENEYEYLIEMPITPKVPAGKVIVNKIPSTAKVKIKGSGKSLIALGISGDAHYELDLSDVEKNQIHVLVPKNVFLMRPAGAIVTEEIITPDSITVLLNEIKKKRVPVQPNIVPMTAPGHTIVGNIRLTPDSIDIEGPASLVAQIDRVYTQEAEYSDLKFDFKKLIALAPLPSDKISVSATQVEVYINVQKLSEITLNGVPVEFRNLPKNMTVTIVPSTLSLVLEGGGMLLSQISRDNIVAYIDYDRVKDLPGNEFPAVIDKPAGISYRDVKPRTFKIIYGRRYSQ
jgi:YbbR domain-containing protein